MLTGKQVINELEDRLGWPQSATLEGTLTPRTRKMLLVLNRVLKNMGALEQWSMLRKEGTLITEASIERSLLLDMTNGSDVVALSSFEAARAAAAGETPFTFSLSHKQWAIQFGEESTPIYRIAEILTPQSARLNRVWLGTTVAPASVDDTMSSFKMAMDQYVLPEDFDRPTGEWADFLSAYNVTPAGPEEFAKYRRGGGSAITVGDPKLYTVYGLDPTESYQVLHFHPWPVSQAMMQYNYQRVHPTIEQDVDHILFPQAQLGMIIEFTLGYANRDFEDDARMQANMLEGMLQFRAVKSQNMVVSDHKGLSPWRGNRARSVLSMRGNDSVRWDYGEYFDIAGNTKLP